MDQQDFRKIQVGDQLVGIMGLSRVMEEIAATHANEPDAVVRDELVSRLSGKNYISSSSREAYGAAFLREFRKFLGRPCDEPQDNTVRIMVLGPGCFQCNEMERTVMRLLSEMGMAASLEHVTDLNEIAKYGLMRLPALIINGKVVSAGGSPTDRRIREWLSEFRGPDSGAGSKG